MPNNQRPAASKPPSSPPAIGHISADGMATVLIGPSKIKYLVHKALLVHHSEYFTKALGGQWLEAEERLVSLDDVDTSAFNLFIHWLYTQRLPHDNSSFRSVVKGSAFDGVDYVNNGLILLEAYALGDSLLAPKFRQDVNNNYIERRNFFRATPTVLLNRVAFAFANIPHDRVIFQFLVNDFCLRFDPNTVHKSDASALMAFPPDFSARVIRRYGYCGRDNKYDGCYLEHTSEEAKQACGKTHMEFVGEGIDYGFFGEPRVR